MWFHTLVFNFQASERKRSTNDQYILLVYIPILPAFVITSSKESIAFEDDCPIRRDINLDSSPTAIQINHAGASAQSARINMQPVSASDVPSKAGGEIPRPLEKDEIMHIVKKYGEAAKRAQIAGFDAVEIHAGHSYLISQFLSPLTNKRTDEFGGSLENRARLAKLVIEEVRRQDRKSVV